MHRFFFKFYILHFTCAAYTGSSDSADNVFIRYCVLWTGYTIPRGSRWVTFYYDCVIYMCCTDFSKVYVLGRFSICISWY